MTTLKKNKKFVAVLGFAHLTPLQITEKSELIVTKMSGNSNFPTPAPALASITALINTAKQAISTASTKNKGTAAPMHEAIQALEAEMKGLVGYVETIANANQANGTSIIQSSGMDVKKPASRKPKTFSVKAENSPGAVLLNTKAVSRSSYNYQVTTDSTLASGWTTIAISNTAKYLKTGLTSGTRYFFRVAIVTKNVQGDWSPVLNVVAP